MQAGQLRHRVQLTTKTVTRGTNGEEIVTYPVTATLWANVEVVGGGETIAQQQAAATLTHQVTIRYYSGLEPTMRLNWLRGDGTARTLVITAPPIEDATRRQMILNCSELV
jgi:SPP1 family predicted phage head-tail adaptor